MTDHAAPELKLPPRNIKFKNAPKASQWARQGPRGEYVRQDTYSPPKLFLAPSRPLQVAPVNGMPFRVQELPAEVIVAYKFLMDYLNARIEAFNTISREGKYTLFIKVHHQYIREISQYIYDWYWSQMIKHFPQDYATHHFTTSEVHNFWG